MKYAIGIDLGGTFIKYGIIKEEDSSFLIEGKMPSMADISADKIIEQLIKSINICIDYSKSHDFDLCGVGVGTPGIVDEKRGIVFGGADNLKGWSDIHLSEIIKKETGLNSYIGNDANMMAFGEVIFGAARGLTDVVFLTIGTGIGGGLILNGKLYGGYDNRGTELGHIPLNIEGVDCNCGGRGCLEAYASTSALLKQYKYNLNESGIDVREEITGELLIKNYLSGESCAIKTMCSHWHYLGHGVAAFINIFSPQAVVIGGGISDAGEFYIDGIRKEAFNIALPDCSVNTRVVGAALGNKAAILGAAANVLENY
ncbi:MAG: ROK family protein [Bacteroidales bacterium]|nr:ROK family protein [Bacteroidales bacterium]